MKVMTIKAIIKKLKNTQMATKKVKTIDLI